MYSIVGKLAGSSGSLFSPGAREAAEVLGTMSQGVFSGFDCLILSVAASCLRRDHYARKSVSLLFAAPVQRATPCHRFRVRTIALPLLEGPLDMMFGDKRGNGISHPFGHRHGFHDSLARQSEHVVSGATASTTLLNSASIPSPVFLTIRPRCSAILGSTSARRWA